MKLPAYPIATIDPHFSIWSKADRINEDDTYLWCGIKKRIEGTLILDGERYTFLGKNSDYVGNFLEDENGICSNNTFKHIILLIRY